MPRSKARKSVCVLIVFLGSLAMLACPTSSIAAPSTVYLRPNLDMRLGGWSVIGADSAWSALDDAVTESQAPDRGDYVLSGHKTLRIGLDTTSLAGAAITGASAWIYTADPNPVTLEAKEGSGAQLATGRFESPGWHSISLPLDNRQSRLDSVFLSLRGATRTGPGRASVHVAFLRLRLDQPGPRVYWGAWMDGDVYGSGLGDAPWSSTTWDRFEEHTGKPASLVHLGQPAPWNQAFQAGTLDLIAKRGAIPLMDMGSNGVSSASIASGAYDSYLASWADAARSYGKPFFFRWEWEMNGRWFPWGAEAAQSPATYVSAWRHFHDVAEAQGATNVTWVWCPNTIFPGSTSLASLYPGNSYVDWTCVDGYNFGENPFKPGGWTSFYDLFSSTYDALTSLAPAKPVMIGETASTEFGGSKPVWIANALGNALPNSFPRIKAVAWFNWNIFEGGGRLDWPIESSGAAQESFANAISSPYYAGNAFGNLEPLTPVQPLP